jgi:ABC-2 type transport system permease protein
MSNINLSSAMANTASSVHASNWIAYKTIVNRELSRILRIWGQTLVPPAITMTLYFLIFGNLIGSRIGVVGGVPYIQFIVPGLVMMSVIQNAYGNVSSSFFGSKFGRYIEELMVSPAPSWVILAGYVTGGVARGLMVGAIVLIISLLFSRLEVAHPLMMLVTVVLTAIVFSLAGFVNAVYAKKFDDIAIIPTFILTPLTYLGGVFYSISQLPEFWQKLSYLNPVLYMVEAFRYGILGKSDVSLTVALLMTLSIAISLWILCWQMVEKGVGLRT